MSKLYAERDTVEQGQHYMKHLLAMTAEKLHSKGDVAAELAHRDIMIEQLQARVNELEQALRNATKSSSRYDVEVIAAEMQVFDAVPTRASIENHTTLKLGTKMRVVDIVPKHIHSCDDSGCHTCGHLYED